MLALYPAIDVRAGGPVRLTRGDFAAETVYADDPVAVARTFAAAGAEWIHVVDLDAARTGEPSNLAVVEAIAASVPCPVQAGGGVRSLEAADVLLLAGAARVVIGTAAVETPALVADCCAVHPGPVAVGLDGARARTLPPRAGPRRAARTCSSGSGPSRRSGWRRWSSPRSPGTAPWPVALDQLGAVLATTELPVIASGGVGRLDDIGALVGVTVAGRRLFAVPTACSRTNRKYG